MEYGIIYSLFPEKRYGPNPLNPLQMLPPHSPSPRRAKLYTLPLLTASLPPIP